MPNWTYNQINAQGIHRLPLYDEKGNFDFNKIIPMPKSLDIEAGSRTDLAVAWYLTGRGVHDVMSFDDDIPGERFPTEKDLEALKTDVNKPSGITPDELYNMGRTYVMNYHRYGCFTWYEWCNRVWNTKWNATDTLVSEDIVSFDTAWAAPFPVIRALSEMYPDIEFTHIWQDEDEYITHEAVWLNGDITDYSCWEDEDEEEYDVIE